MPPGSTICNLKDVPVDQQLTYQTVPSLKSMVQESIARCQGDADAQKKTVMKYVAWEARVSACGERKF